MANIVETACREVLAGPRTETDPFYTSSPYEPELAATTRLDEIDLLDPVLYHRGDPHAVWRKLRQEAPVFWHEKGTRGTDDKGFWVFTRYEDIEKLYKDSRRFVSTKGPFLDFRREDVPNRILPSLDGPDHRRLRALVARFFTPPALKSVEDHIRGVATRLIDGVIERGEADFSLDLAEPLVAEVTCDLLGVPFAEVREMAEVLFRVESNEVDAISEYNNAVLSYFDRELDIRRKGDGTSITDRVAQAFDPNDPDAPTREDLIHLLWVLFLGGTDSTTHTLTGGLLSLFHHPDQLAKLTADPSLVGNSVEEILRWTATSHANKRYVMEDSEIGGTLIRKGDYVSMWSPSANRDEAVFADPFRFDVTRKCASPVTTFGAGGQHHCIGAHFARMETRILLEEVFARLPDIRPSAPAIRSPAYTMLISPVTSMPVVFSPQRARLAA